MSLPQQKILAPDILSAEIRQKIDHWIQKFPEDQKQSAVIPALMIVQKDNGGHLTTELMDAVAYYLEMPRIAVYEVASFYIMYDLKPVGRHKVCVCTNISCMLRGAYEIFDHIKQKYNVKVGGTTEDGKFTLKEFECLGACANAPMMMIDEDYHENLSIDKVDEILEGLE